MRALRRYLAPHLPPPPALLRHYGKPAVILVPRFLILGWGWERARSCLSRRFCCLSFLQNTWFRGRRGASAGKVFCPSSSRDCALVPVTERRGWKGRRRGTLARKLDSRTFHSHQCSESAASGHFQQERYIPEHFSPAAGKAGREIRFRIGRISFSRGKAGRGGLVRLRFQESNSSAPLSVVELFICMLVCSMVESVKCISEKKSISLI